MVAPLIIAAVIKGVVDIANSQPQAAPAVSGANQSSVFDSSGWTTATSGSHASGGGGFSTSAALWFLGGFASVYLLMRFRK